MSIHLPINRLTISTLGQVVFLGRNVGWWRGRQQRQFFDFAMIRGRGDGRQQWPKQFDFKEDAKPAEGIKSRNSENSRWLGVFN